MTSLQLFVFLLLQTARCCTITVGDQNYDFSSISTKDYTVTGPSAEQGEYTYQASFCSDRIACGSFIYGNLVRSKGDVCQGVYGKWASAVNVKTSTGFQATFQSTQYCTDDFSKLYKSTFNFLCDTSAGDIGSLKASQVGANSCEYSIAVYTNLVCSGSTPVNTSSTGGLSGGSVFLIILVVLVAVYFLAGYIYNYYKAKTVVAPHRDFWCARLPFWTKTGCILSWITTVTFCQTSYSWCCMKIFKAKPEDDKMATALFEGDSD